MATSPDEKRLKRYSPGLLATGSSTKLSFRTGNNRIPLKNRSFAECCGSCSEAILKYVTLTHHASGFSVSWCNSYSAVRDLMKNYGRCDIIILYNKVRLPNPIYPFRRAAWYKDRPRQRTPREECFGRPCRETGSRWHSHRLAGSFLFAPPNYHKKTKLKWGSQKNLSIRYSDMFCL